MIATIPIDGNAMTDPSQKRLSLAGAILLASTMTHAPGSFAGVVHPSTDGPHTFTDTYQVADALADASGQREASLPDVSPVAVQFVSAADTAEFNALVRTHDVLAPDARGLAKAFIREQLGIDGDTHVVAHFATAESRVQGNPDQATSLTDALMGAFPDHARHNFLALSADAVGGLLHGGEASVDPVSFIRGVAHTRDGKDFFHRLWTYFRGWTGPGYLYNTFFAKRNIIDKVREDSRPLDEAFGIYRRGGYTREYASPLLLSQLVSVFGASGAFSDLPYVKRLNQAIDGYWVANRANWSLLARYEFITRARQAHSAGELTDDQYALVMRGGAPRVPLSGPVTLAQLRSTVREGGVTVRRFDVNGYVASDLVRFIAADGSEVMYIPGGSPGFVALESEQALRHWVKAQTRDPRSLEAVLSHFSIYNTQDGTFWTGVKQGLEYIRDGQWQSDGGSVDHKNAEVTDDVFEDMRVQTERRLRDDARMQASTAWDAWRTTLDRAATLLAPLGFVPALTMPVMMLAGAEQTGTGIEQAIDGRNQEDRTEGLLKTGTGIVSTALAGIAPARETEAQRPWFRDPQRVNGHIGYPLSPTGSPRLPALEPAANDFLTQIAQRNPHGPLITSNPRMLQRASEILDELGLPDEALRGMDPKHAEQSPLAMLALGHSFLENLPARLLDEADGPWSEMEARVIAPNLAKALERPLAFYDSGTLEYVAMPGGRIDKAIHLPNGRAPLNSLDINRVGNKYHVTNNSGRPGTFDSVVTATEWLISPTESSQYASRFEGPGRIATWQDDIHLRKQLVKDLESRSTLPELERMHREWFKRDLPARSRLVAISKLRHGIFNEYEDLTTAELMRLQNANNGKLGRMGSSVATNEDAAKAANEALKDIVDKESALLPETLDHLLVKDSSALPRTFTPDGDDWTMHGRRYVQLRDLHGRTQVIETGPEGLNGRRAILVPGKNPEPSDATHEIFKYEGAWYPVDSAFARQPTIRLRAGNEPILTLPTIP